MVLSLVALTPGVAVLMFLQVQISNSRRAEIRDLAMRSAQQANTELDRIVFGLETLLIAVSNTPDVRGFHSFECDAYVGAIRPKLPHLTGITLLDKEGRYRCGFPLPPGSTFSDRSYFRDAMSESGLVVGEFVIGRATTRPVLPISLGIRNPDGQAVGVLAATIDLAWLSEQLKERGLPPGGFVTVADRNGTIIARQPDPEKFIGSKIPEAFMRLVNASAVGVEEVTSQDGGRRVLGYVPTTQRPRGLYISAGLSADDSYDAVRRAVWYGMLLALGAALATLSATWLAGRYFFVRPLQKLSAVLQAWRGGERLARSHSDPVTGEIGAVGWQIDQLMDEVARHQDQRDLLAAELDHRVKNTFATIQAIANFTFNKSEPAKEVLPVYLARIVALSQTHDVLTRDHWQGAPLEVIVHSVLRPLVPDMELRCVISGPSLNLPAPDTLSMTLVLHELCTNAMKHGSLVASQGRVEIYWSVNHSSTGYELDFEWRELNGPSVTDPGPRSGFGSRLMSRAFGARGTVKLNYEITGLVCRLKVRALVPSGEPSVAGQSSYCCRSSEAPGF